MELKRFDKSFSNLTKVFKKGFYKKPDKFEIDVFCKIIDFQLQVLIITSRLEEDIAKDTIYTKHIVDSLKVNKRISHSESENFGINLSKLRLDLSDFYFYTRMFLDALTVGIKSSLINAGNKNAEIMKDSVRYLLNEKNMKTYKEKIDPIFFNNLEKHLNWIRTLRDSRDGLVHYYYHIVSTTTKQGELGFEIMDRKKSSWGTDTVKGISVEIQTIINSITDLLDFLSTNLPRNRKMSEY